MEIRGYTIAYSKKLAKSKRESENILQVKLNNLMAKSENCRDNPQLRVDMHYTRVRLQEIIE